MIGRHPPLRTEPQPEARSRPNHHQPLSACPTSHHTSAAAICMLLPSCCRCCLQSGYPCLSLHGGKEQSDRECTIADFKGAVCNILVATSVAARGLDVRDLVLVVNYDVPNHHEDYVHR